MKILKYAFVILIILLVLAYFTNPKIEQHKDKVKSKLQNSLVETLSKQGISKDNPIMKSINNEMYEDMVWTVIDKKITYNNYYIFSMTQVEYMGQNYPISLGLYNNVIVMPQLEDQIKNRINTFIQDNGGLRELLGL